MLRCYSLTLHPDMRNTTMRTITRPRTVVFTMVTPWSRLPPCMSFSVNHPANHLRVSQDIYSRFLGYTLTYISQLHHHNFAAYIHLHIQLYHTFSYGGLLSVCVGDTQVTTSLHALPTDSHHTSYPG